MKTCDRTPATAIVDTCLAMYKAQPALAQACLARWTRGTAMAEPTRTVTPRGTGLTPTELLANCVVLEGIDPRGTMTGGQARAFLACVDRWLPVMQGARP
jgi:hypothetical protein